MAAKNDIRGILAAANVVEQFERADRLSHTESTPALPIEAGTR
jgi:hypothetical protein